jgi:hypothetical protein
MKNLSSALHSKIHSKSGRQMICTRSLVTTDTICQTLVAHTYKPRWAG